MKIGTYYWGNRSWEFVVWAPFTERVTLKILSPYEKLVPLRKDISGYHRTIVDDLSEETLYFFVLDGEKERPDPASHYQPKGVHGPSQVVAHELFKWQDSLWAGIGIAEMIIYELHIGAFTHEGTFDALVSRLDELRAIGINTMEIMPVSQFPGERNWGYDGVFPFSVQNSYGGPYGLKKLVDECHKKGMAVILDVVYNHLGPEGNYLGDYGPYFTDRYSTPWGEALNFDGPYSNNVRNYFIQNALFWLENYHIDALRIDAIHGIFDMSAKHFLRELAEAVEEYSLKKGKKYYLIAESNLNDTRVVQPSKEGGYGLDSFWCDDFHHALHGLLTEETGGYYTDFGGMKDLAKSLKEGFVYTGQYSRFRKRNHGGSSKDIPGERFVVFAQNHDQIGNRMNGERLSSLVSFESLKLAASVVLLSPYVPLFFMGEEYSEVAPFLYFVSHSDQRLVEAVRQGRIKEFRSFNWQAEPPDPQSMETFMKSKIDWNLRDKKKNRTLLHFYGELIRLRKETPALLHLDKKCIEVQCDEEKKILLMTRWKEESRAVIVYNFSTVDEKWSAPPLKGIWKKALDSSDTFWNGPGTLLQDQLSPGRTIVLRQRSVAVYVPSF